MDSPRNPEHTWYVADRWCLGDPEHLAVIVAIGPDGTQSWALADHDHVCRWCPMQPPPEHERVGKLPRAMRARVWPCQAIARTTGVPCTNPAPRGQRYCAHHQHLEVA